MAAFNMKDFNEILEKCKDKSKQAEQDKVSEKQKIINFCIVLFFIFVLFRKFTNRFLK